MSSTTSNVSPRQDPFWWQGSLMEMKAAKLCQRSEPIE
jgi:hypothetical protein